MNFYWYLLVFINIIQNNICLHRFWHLTIWTWNVFFFLLVHWAISAVRSDCIWFRWRRMRRDCELLTHIVRESINSELSYKMLNYLWLCQWMNTFLPPPVFCIFRIAILCTFPWKSAESLLFIFLLCNLLNAKGIICVVRACKRNTSVL